MSISGLVPHNKMNRTIIEKKDCIIRENTFLSWIYLNYEFVFIYFIMFIILLSSPVLSNDSFNQTIIDSSSSSSQRSNIYSSATIMMNDKSSVAATVASPTNMINSPVDLLNQIDTSLKKFTTSNPMMNFRHKDRRTISSRNVNSIRTRHHSLFWSSSPSSSSSLVTMRQSQSSLSPFSDNSCRSNCSGHGDCYNGTCFCEVEYSGGTCDHPNLKYYISFSTVYYMICVVSFIQLMLCINSEIARQKPRSITRAFRVNIQKALYFFICIATAIRGFYFSSPSNGQLAWTESLMSAYYPILMSGSSLLVCFWAEVFHLDASVEQSHFLDKSFFGFILFNGISYSLYLAEFLLLSFTNPTDTDKGFFMSIFNSIYAFLMLVVVVFFLIYGVEVYFKVRGAFAPDRETESSESISADISQLQQSRLGLISQAVLLLVTILFMLSEVFGFLWKDKVAVLSRNYHQVMFRVVEFGVALWFPCVLWNCIQPEQLWILNPRRILKRRQSQFDHRSMKSLDDDDKCRLANQSVAESEYLVGGRLDAAKSMTTIPECWICYETALSKPEAGPMIQPCLCRGDVSAVHHSCLLRWLMESCSSSTAPVSCKVCGSAYKVEHSQETVWLPAGLTIAHWFKTATIIMIMCCTLGGSIMIVKLFHHMYVKMISVGSAILVEYICLRFLGFNMISAYHRAKLSAIKIMGRRIQINQQQNQNMNNNHLNDNGGSIVEESSSVNFAVAKEQETVHTNNTKNHHNDKQSHSQVELVYMNHTDNNSNDNNMTIITNNNHHHHHHRSNI
ncbi:uncharacterized protein LOC124494423 [Dermatophagoides farinae]|uniref:uncharacterized protein LOC124494423 n=1 Tax=Dermatophagoides farinae TaxID=6954 RepID=UPI003F602245